MTVIFILFVFTVGLFIGSFLNVIVDRIHSGESPYKGRSHCDNCKKTLIARDLIPLFSYIILRGKCRYCGKKMSIYYPIVELLSGLLMANAAYYILIGREFINAESIYSLIPIFTFCLILISTLIVIFFADLKYGIIPFNAVSIGVLVSLLWHLVLPEAGLSSLNYFLSALIVFAGFLLLFLITRGKGIGFGDVTYAFFMGLLLGFPKVLLALYVAFISGAIISVVLVIMKKKKMKGGTIPFGPFLVYGTITSLFWGDLLLAKILPYLLVR